MGGHRGAVVDARRDMRAETRAASKRAHVTDDRPRPRPAAGLETRLYLSVQHDEIYCKIRAGYDRLLRSVRQRVAGVITLVGDSMPDERARPHASSPVACRDALHAGRTLLRGSHAMPLLSSRGIPRKMQRHVHGLSPSAARRIAWTLS